MAGGYSNGEIAHALGVAEGTIKNHVSNILAKFAARDRTRAVLALLDGDPATAARLARAAAKVSDHALSRADNLATLARALMATGDNRAARAAIAGADALAPWWPRVATTRTRLTL